MTDDGRTSLELALPAYEIAGKLGQGAFGVVYEARHTQLGRQVAIKQLPQNFAEDAEVRERFVAEAQMVASLDHPHIVPVYDFVESAGSRFLIMERLQGSVGDRFKTEGIVTDEACAALLACLSALDFAHQKGLLHRDVKPENLLYDASGVVKLGDFGIARDLGAETRRTATGMIIGTPAYMSPEQCRGDDLTPASDVYSVAIMGYELMTGMLPFPDSGSVNGLLAHHLVTEPTPLLATRPELPGAIGEVIDRALKKDLALRYSTASEFATALARACVTAFGSGWIRRRRFVLHWPEIIAETERPGDNSPRTGTIMVRAGHPPHAVVPDNPVPTAHLPPSSPAAPLAANAPTLAPPSATPDLIGTPASTASPSTPWPLVGGIAAAVLALVLGLVIFTGNDEPETLAAPVATVEPAESPVVEPTPIPATAVAPEADPPVAQEPQASEPTALPATTPTPFVLVITERPDDLDEYDASSPFTPTPCPTDQERVACIFAAIAVDEDTGELLVPYFTEGFVPQLEPADYHLHFYLDSAVDGDETKAGTQTPGGSWRNWDAPYPATSFGGENGRSLFTLADYVDTSARNLCVIVADPEQRAIPGSGNCAPLLRPGNDQDTLRFVNRLSGQFIGSCGLDMTAIVPNDWSWVDLVANTPADAARQIQPADLANTTDLLTTFVETGVVLWARAPVVDGRADNFTVSIYPGDFTLSSTPDEIDAGLRQIGFETSGLQERTIDNRTFVYAAITSEADQTTTAYFIPDHGYTIVMEFSGSPEQNAVGVADQILPTVMGC